METTKLKAAPGDYNEEQSEFLRAVSDFRTRTGRHVLRATDHFRVMRDLGYSKNPIVPTQN